MATTKVNGVRLFSELTGSGAVPLVLVHGSWDSHHDWDLVVPRLAEAFRVLTYDRRGHSQSERPTGQGSVREDVADLAALIEHLGLGPAWVVGNSFGASISLRLAGERPDLFRGLIAHEPPLFSLRGDDPTLAPLPAHVHQRIGAVVERIASGDHAAAAEQFVETVALGPGTWARLPHFGRQTLIENAPTFLDREARSPASAPPARRLIAALERSGSAPPHTGSLTPGYRRGRSLSLRARGRPRWATSAARPRTGTRRAALLGTCARVCAPWRYTPSEASDPEQLAFELA